MYKIDDYKLFDEYNDQVSSLQDQFEELFSHPPAELQVSSIIRGSPLGACSDALASALLSSALADPLSIDASVSSIVASLSTTKDLIFTDTEAGWIDTPFNDVFAMDLGDCLNTTLHESYLHKVKQTVTSPKNTVLSSALLAGIVVRDKLLGPNLVNEFVDQGLQLPDVTPVEKQKREAVLIGACFILLVAGSVLLDNWRKYDPGRLQRVVEALEVLKQEKVIKYPTGVDLLEVCSLMKLFIRLIIELQRTINAAKGQFKVETTAAEVWVLLFPPVSFPSLRILTNLVGGWFR